MKPKPVPLLFKCDIDRFWTFVPKREEGYCWEWTGCYAGSKTSSCRYGAFQMAGEQFKAHRISWAIHTGRSPVDRVLHQCDNPKCVNPAHLFEGSLLDNARDRARKGRSAMGDRNGSRLFPDRLPRGNAHAALHAPESYTRGDDHWTRVKGAPQGEAVPWSKLTENDVLDIRTLTAFGATTRALADVFNLTTSNVRQIVRRLTWSHI